MERRRIVDCLRDHAGLRKQGQVGGIDLENLIEVNEAENDSPFHGDTAAGKPRPGAAGHDGHLLLSRPLDDSGRFLGSVRRNHANGPLLHCCGAVEPVWNQVLRLCKDVFRPDDCREFPELRAIPRKVDHCCHSPTPQ